MPTLLFINIMPSQKPDAMSVFLKHQERKE